jgi:hypothetical protein
MYLKCDLCGERIYLAKYYPSSGWYLSPPKDGKEWDVKFNEFLDKHSPYVRRGADGEYAEPGKGKNSKHGEPNYDQKMYGSTFTLEYEIEAPE